MRRSTKELVKGFLWLALAVLMVACIAINIHTGNISGIIVCSFAIILNILNAILSFKEYKLTRQWEDEYLKALAEKAEKINNVKEV